MDVATVQTAIGIATAAPVTKVVPMKIAIKRSIEIGDVGLFEKRLPRFTEVLNELASRTPEG